MANDKNRKYRLRKRIFLNEDYDNTSWIAGFVTNAKKQHDSDDPAGARLVVERGWDRVVLDFAIELPDEQKESLKTIKAFETLLRQFRSAVEKEIKLRNKLSYRAIEDDRIDI